MKCNNLDKESLYSLKVEMGSWNVDLPWSKVCIIIKNDKNDTTTEYFDEI